MYFLITGSPLFCPLSLSSLPGMCEGTPETLHLGAGSWAGPDLQDPPCCKAQE